MATKVKRMTAKQADKADALAQLRELCPPGTTVYAVLRHVSRSGMSRAIDFYILQGQEHRWLSPMIARAGLFSFDTKREALRVGGCGMDMGFHVVSNLSYYLYPAGFGCIGERCPSNDHSNGDRDYTPHGAQWLDACHEQVCWCHDSSRPLVPGRVCSACGCFDTVAHWHRSGDYALKSRWI